jgi:hypothetical protein
MAEEQGKAIRIDFDVPPDFPTKYASNLVVQHTEHDFTITFFDIRPPLLLGSADDKIRQLEGIEAVKAAPVARIVVAASRMHEFVQVLQDNLKTYRAAVAEKETRGDRE